jgi:hypothetical protein
MQGWWAMTHGYVAVRNLTLCGVLLGIGLFTGCGG